MFRIFGKNDWELLEAVRGNWNITTTHIYGDKSVTTEDCWYEIWYSPSRNRGKMKMGGYRPKEHTRYPIAVKRMYELVNRERNKS